MSCIWSECDGEKKKRVGASLLMLLRCRDTTTMTLWQIATNQLNQTRQEENTDNKRVYVHKVISRKEWMNDGGKAEFICWDQAFIIWIFLLNFPSVCVSVCVRTWRSLGEVGALYMMCRRAGKPAAVVRTWEVFWNINYFIESCQRQKRETIPLDKLYSHSISQF